MALNNEERARIKEGCARAGVMMREDPSFLTRERVYKLQFDNREETHAREILDTETTRVKNLWETEASDSYGDAVTYDGVDDASQYFAEQVDRNWYVQAMDVVTVVSPGDQEYRVGNSVRLQVRATSSFPPITFGASGLPAGLTINTTTGIVSGTISGGADGGSPYEVSITGTASDDAETVVEAVFTFTVNP